MAGRIHSELWDTATGKIQTSVLDVYLLRIFGIPRDSQQTASASLYALVA
ncbi:MAG: hypothetical protein F2614_01070 [Actinobacteria bacterium]|nr:hypothetical protein [Actinomycetota bacterium]